MSLALLVGVSLNTEHYHRVGEENNLDKNKDKNTGCFQIPEEK